MSWNSFKTDAPPGLTASTITYPGAGGDSIHAYVVRPEGNGPFPGIVVVHHLPGWDEFYLEFTRRLATHGYLCISPDLYCRAGHGTPDDVAAKVRADGGVSDEQVVGDCSAAADWLRQQPGHNGKVGIIGTCSGGRHSVVVASKASGFDAVVDLWGGGVVMAPDQLNDKRPVAPIDMTKDLNPPLLGLFGNDDQAPSPEQVNQHEEALKQAGKQYEFHRYDGAGHGFFYYHAPLYRQQQAMDGWGKVFDFFQRTLS
jgi:carboxymethylenebutenolidase